MRKLLPAGVDCTLLPWSRELPRKTFRIRIVSSDSIIGKQIASKR
jgi:hypothetical protein